MHRIYILIMIVVSYFITLRAQKGKTERQENWTWESVAFPNWQYQWWNCSRWEAQMVIFTVCIYTGLIEFILKWDDFYGKQLFVSNFLRNTSFLPRHHWKFATPTKIFAKEKKLEISKSLKVAAAGSTLGMKTLSIIFKFHLWIYDSLMFSHCVIAQL